MSIYRVSIAAAMPQPFLQWLYVCLKDLCGVSIAAATPEPFLLKTATRPFTIEDGFNRRRDASAISTKR